MNSKYCPNCWREVSSINGEARVQLPKKQGTDAGGFFCNNCATEFYILKEEKSEYPSEWHRWITNSCTYNGWKIITFNYWAVWYIDKNGFLCYAEKGTKPLTLGGTSLISMAGAALLVGTFIFYSRNPPSLNPSTVGRMDFGGLLIAISVSCMIWYKFPGNQFYINVLFSKFATIAALVLTLSSGYLYLQFAEQGNGLNQFLGIASVGSAIFAARGFFVWLKTVLPRNPKPQ